MLLLMIVLRPTNEASIETFSYVEALPTESEDQEIVQEDNDRCFRRRNVTRQASADHRTSELASLSDIRNQRSVDQSIQKADIE